MQTASQQHQWSRSDATAQPSAQHSVASLRAITYRISSTPTKQLPAVAAQLASSVWNCKDILSLDPQGSKSSNEATTTAHRFKTTLTSLLQDRTIEGRWAAVVLTKAAIEAGGLATLSKSNGWVKSLIAILKKPDPPTTRQLAVITLTRIFMLTWDHSNLVREMTTPALPAFISTCLSNVERDRCSAGELEAVLDAFATLILRHPTVFRTHEAQIRTMVLSILSTSSGSSESGVHFSRSHERSAARLLILLHHCAPKQGAADAWEKTWSSTMLAAHETCAQLFRSIIEDPDVEGLTSRPAPTAKNVFGDMGITNEDALGLQPWRGVFAGKARLMTLISLLETSLETATADRVNLRLGTLVELLARILNITLDIEMDSSRYYHEVPKDEREALFCALTDIHVAALDLITSLVQRFEIAAAPFIQVLQELTIGVFKAEHSIPSVRTASYTTLNHILRITGPSMSKADVAVLGTVVASCCKELLPVASNAHNSRTSETTALNGTDRTSPQSTEHPQFSHLINASNTLLTTLATKINPFTMPSKLRVQIERTAILARNKDALVALVLNPAAKGSRRALETSLLPILARENPDEPEVEALLRPRMPPVVRRQGGVDDDAGVNGLEEEDLEEDAMQANGTEGTDLFENKPLTVAQRDGLRTGDSESQTGQDDELYSLTPPRNVSNEFEEQVVAGASPTTAADGLNSMKRSAEVEIAQTSPPAKRARMSPKIDPVMDMADTTSVVLSGRQIQDPVESAQPALGQFGSQDVSQSRLAHMAVEHATTTHDVIGSDESDFEMPPLTMEPDTDPEDDEEDEEE